MLPFFVDECASGGCWTHHNLQLYMIIKEKLKEIVVSISCLYLMSLSHVPIFEVNQCEITSTVNTKVVVDDCIYDKHEGIELCKGMRLNSSMVNVTLAVGTILSDMSKSVHV